MRVRQLFGTRADTIVEMPYAVALRAIASGTVASLEVPSVVEADLAVPRGTQAVQVAERHVSPAVDTSPRTIKRVHPAVASGRRR